MNSSEKCEILKDTIYQLYSKEGRSKVYISNLLQIDRKVLTYKIKEWNLPEAEPIRYMKPSTKKFLNRNKEFILSQLKKDQSLESITASLNCTRDKLKTLFLYDEDLKIANDEKNNRIHTAHQQKIEELKAISSHNYEIIDFPGEIWKSIMGYDGYMVSNYGRVKNYASRYNSYYLLTLYVNTSNRVYVTLRANNGEHKTLNLARLVAHAFVPGYSEEANNVNYKDGNTLNNNASNLEWVYQADNNLHDYRVLNREPLRVKKLWREILYKDKYKFKTIAAFAKFINKSETQAYRYIEEPEKHDIKLIYR